MSEMSDFVESQIGRAKLRAWILRHGIQSALFWTAYFVLWSLADAAGIGWVGWVGLGIYGVLAMPSLVLQVVLVADLLAYVVIGKIFAYPQLAQATAEWARENPLRPTLWSRVVIFLFDVSPLSSFAVWSLLVLARMPHSVHGELRGPTKLKKQETEMARAMYGSAARRLRVA